MSANTTPIRIPLPDCLPEYATLYTPEYIGDANFVYQGKGLISYLDADNHVGLMNTRGEIVLSAEHGWTEFQFEPEADVIRARKADCWILFDSKGKQLAGYGQLELLQYTRGIFVQDPKGKQIGLDSLNPFHDGLALGKKDGRSYYVDTNGRIALTIQENCDYTFHDFSDGMAVISTKWKLLKGKKYGYINKSGKIVIPPKYRAAEPFSNGLAAVLDEDGWHYIDTQGNRMDVFPVLGGLKDLVQPLPFGKNHVVVYLNNRNEVHFLGTGIHCILDRSGFLTPVDCRDLIAAGDDHFIFCSETYDHSPRKYGLLDANGKQLLPERYEGIHLLPEGSFLLIENGKMGLADQKGNILVEPQWEKIYPLGEFQKKFKGFSRDHALVARKHSKFGLLDFQGNQLLPPVYDHTPFYNGSLAFILDNGRGILLNRNQQNVLPDDINAETILMHGLLLVTMGGKTYFLDYGCDM